jgi:hypothetical protein
MTKAPLLFLEKAFYFEKKVGERKSLYQLVFVETVDSKVLIAVVVSLNRYGPDFMTVPQTLLSVRLWIPRFRLFPSVKYSVKTQYKL